MWKSTVVIARYPVVLGLRGAGGEGAIPGSYHLPNWARRLWSGFDFSHPYFVKGTHADAKKERKNMVNNSTM